ncbi:MAG: DUF192 domain-containing protein [Paenibacillaceae bacterium]
MLINKETGKVLANDVCMARTFWSRFRGLMFTSVFRPGTALHIQPCRSIHTFFMRYPIDVLYLDSNLKVIAVEENVKPGKFGRIHRKASSVVELPIGVVSETETEIGQEVQFQIHPNLIEEEK